MKQDDHFSEMCDLFAKDLEKNGLTVNEFVFMWENQTKFAKMFEWRDIELIAKQFQKRQQKEN